VHTEHSLLDGINKIKEYPRFCKDKLGAEACAITDHGNLGGAWAFTKECREVGIRPLIGLEAYVSGQDLPSRERNEHGKAYYHLILLAQHNAGLKNLFALNTRAAVENTYYKPRVTNQMLEELNEGLLATSACLGSLFSQTIMAGDHKQAERLIDYHAALFKDRFFIELQTHQTPEQALVNNVLISIAKRKNLPLVLTSDAHYEHARDKGHHELTLRMNTNASPDDDGFSFGGIECHLHTHDELAHKAQVQGIPYEAISNTVHVASLIDDASYFSDRRNHFPTFKNLPEGMTSWKYLEAVAWAGLIKRVGFPVPHNYEERFKEELSILKRSGMCDYILVIWEWLNAARERDCWIGPGRGSSGGSLICWALEITQLDPIKYGLLMSRFLNSGRIGKPILF